MTRAGASLALAAALVTGCATARGSTRISSADFNDTVQAMVASLAASGFLADRHERSPQVRIVTNRVLNLSSDVITPAEQWMLIARVQSAFGVQELSQRRNIVFQIPPEEIELLRRRGFDSPLNPEHAPTHLMTATILSSTRAAADPREGFATLRKDFYLIEYVIVDLETRQTAWRDRFEFARHAAGLTID
jgi:hypothetical protein